VYVAAFVFIGLLVTNLGLDTILELATPLLVFIYPIAIVLIMLSFVQYLIGESKLMYQLSVCITSIFALYEVLVSIGFKLQTITDDLTFIPFFDYELGWVLPVCITAIIGYMIDKTRAQVQ